MIPKRAAALAHPNIAFIKYWGNRDSELRIPANSSLSMNLGDLRTETSVEFDSGLEKDELVLDGQAATADQLQRVSVFLDIVRGLAGIEAKARVESQNNFPSGAGIASSSSAFAALALAATVAAGLQLDERSLSRLARRGSGSASRSVSGGFVEWHAGEDDETSYAESISPPDHWALADCIAIVSEERKSVGSTRGHELVATSPLQTARLAGAAERLQRCRDAILERAFDKLAEIVELDSNLMHSVMMTSTPPLFYWEPASITVMHAVRQWRAGGLAVCSTLDAGPNVHVLCEAKDKDRVASELRKVPGVIRVLESGVGGGVILL
ncbi:MAG: diphosphomevalonate decarboxylase [Anaerolineales bacterium]